MRKVNVYIDGFNLYHSLTKYNNQYKWLDLRKLSEQYIDSTTQELKSVYFFTAYPIWNKSKMKRHKDYTKALMSSRVTVRPGKFSKVSRKFRKKNNTIIEYLYNSKRLKSLEKLLGIHIIPDELFYNTHEEKRTDVNIVLQIFEDAVKDKYDDAIIISGDSDIIPVIKSVKNTVQGKKFISLLPIRGKGKDIKNACDSYLHMKTQHLEDSLFPDHIKYGKETIISPYINKKKDLEN